MRILALLTALLALPAFAADVQITWQHPTRDINNALLPATGPESLAATRVEFGTCSGTAFGTSEGSRLVNAPATTTTLTGLAGGRTYCIRAFARNVAGDESLSSNVIQRVTPTVAPQPPVLATTVAQVWEQRRFWRWDYLAQVGSAPLGTACDADDNFRADYYGVDKSEVQIHGRLLTGRLYSRCA